MTSSDIQALAEKAKGGDERAFEMLYSVFFTPLYRYILSQTRHKETAEDIAQNTFIKIYSSLQATNTLPTSFQAYAYAMARNAITDHQRKRKDILPAEAPLEELFQETAVTLPDIRIDEDANEASLFRLLETLSPIEQEIISLYFFADLPHRTIAEAIDRSEVSVRQIQSRALKKLRLSAPQFFS